MRVHPTILAPKASKWQFPVAFGLLGFLLLLTIFRGPTEVVVAQPAQPVEKRLEVLVAHSAIEAGQPLEKADIVLEQRPVSTLPADAITSFEVLKTKVAAGPIPAGYPLAPAFLADPVAVLPTTEKSEPQVVEDPVETLLREIEQDTVAVPITFMSNSPDRGKRVTVTLSKSRGESIVVIEDSWIAKASGREAVLRVEPSQALLLQTAKNYGNFNFIEIPPQSASPYAGKGVSSEAELLRFVEDKPQGEVAKKAPENRVTGYAWVTGEEGTKYGVDDKGNIKPVE